MRFTGICAILSCSAKPGVKSRQPKGCLLLHILHRVFHLTGFLQSIPFRFNIRAVRWTGSPKTRISLKGELTCEKIGFHAALRCAGALDGIATVVYPAHPVESLSLEQIRSIYAGDTSEWDALV